MEAYPGDDRHIELPERGIAWQDIPTIGDLRAIAAELRDHEQSFDLRWKSDMRAIKMGQEAHPGNDLVAVSWAGPSHDDLCVWLMELVNDGWNEGYRDLIDDLQAQVKTLRKAIQAHGSHGGMCDGHPCECWINAALSETDG